MAISQNRIDFNNNKKERKENYISPEKFIQIGSTVYEKSAWISENYTKQSWCLPVKSYWYQLKFDSPSAPRLFRWIDRVWCTEQVFFNMSLQNV